MELPERLEEYVEPEIGIAALAAAALLSPRVRKGLRWGLVQGLAGLLTASDTIMALARQFTPTHQPALDSTFRQQLVDEAHIEQAKRVRAHSVTEHQRPV